MKKFLLLIAIIALLVSVRIVSAAQPSDHGFDQYGYNDTARIFNGTGASWCAQHGINDTAICNRNLGGPFSNDKLVMKWNAAWDACNKNGYNNPVYCAGAWTDNEWNGMNGGSGAVWHYKIIWVGSQGMQGPYWRDGGYLIWGNYEVVMDKGNDKAGIYPLCSDGRYNNGGHVTCTLANPSGYGVNK